MRPWLLALVALAACKRVDSAEVGKKVFHFAVRSQIASFDPVHASDEGTSIAQALVYEPLLQYDYLERPLVLRPLLLAAMPEVSEDQLEYTFTLAPDARFADHEAFAGGVGRTVTSTDVVYSFKRMADPANTPKGWWVFSERIVGFDAYKKAQSAAERFDYEAPVEGFVIHDERRFTIRLTAPYPQLLYVLAMPYTAVVAKEVVEHYGERFARNPVGTGPFRLARWAPGVELDFVKNPTYRDARYPTPTSDDVPSELAAAAGQRVPFLDGVRLHIYPQEQPMWLKWRVGDLDAILVPSDYQTALFDRSQTLRPQFVEDGVSMYAYERIDFVLRGVNMLDPIVGGFGRGKELRKALAAAYDVEEIGRAFYDDSITPYAGPIPPGLAGHDPELREPYRGPNLPLAKALLAEAGYPNGEGLPPLEISLYRGGSSPEQGEMLRRQWSKIGVELDVKLYSWPELSRRVAQKQVQLFALAWNSDYPDAENNLAMFYGPNEAPGSNHFNYARAEYDRLYERVRVMSPSDERTKLYEAMRDMVIEDAPYFGGFARKRYYAYNRRVSNFRPDETWWTWLKYVDVEARRP